MKCWYCNRLIFADAERGALNKATKDHFIPRSSPDRIHFTPDQHVWNVVDSCAECNWHKGSIHPIEAIPHFPEFLAHKMARRLRRLGYGERRIQVALGRRSRVMA